MYPWIILRKIFFLDNRFIILLNNKFYEKRMRTINIKKYKIKNSEKNFETTIIKKIK